MVEAFREKDLLKSCLDLVEDQLGWGDATGWREDEFQELSQRIQQTTGVRLSVTTLKRVWGKVQYDSAPSINTLNTLAQFIGYDHWRNFKQSIPVEEETASKPRKLYDFKFVIVLACLMAFGFISFFSMILSRDIHEPIIDPDSIQFTSRPIAQGLPNSVVFDLNLGSINSDSIIIQQYWDETKTIKIQQNQRQATGIYYYPGYFRAKLLIDGHLIKEHPLYITSENWLGTVDYPAIPKYYSDFQSGHMKWPDEVVDEVEALKKPINTTFHLVKPFRDLSADNFSLRGSVKHYAHTDWSVCQVLRIIILGTEGFMIIPFSRPGCVSNLRMTVNEQFINGKKKDLSMLGFDFLDWKDFRLEVEEKRLTISVENQPIFQTEYQETMGEFVGIKFRFQGIGEVKEVKVDGNY